MPATRSRSRVRRMSRTLGAYDAAVIGSAVYMGRWRRDARRLLKRASKELGTRPLWMFSSGPCGQADPSWAAPPGIERRAKRLGARGHVVFGGRVPLEPSNFIERGMTQKVPPEYSDLRNWDVIRGWAAQIALELRRCPRPTPVPRGDRGRAPSCLRRLRRRRRPLVGMLGALRMLPELVGHLLRGEPPAKPPKAMRLRELTTLPMSGGGWVLLADRLAAAIALGLVGKFWKPVIDFAEVTADGFATSLSPAMPRPSTRFRRGRSATTPARCSQR